MTRFERLIFGAAAVNATVPLLLKVGVQLPFWLIAVVALAGGAAYGVAGGRRD